MKQTAALGLGMLGLKESFVQLNDISYIINNFIENNFNN